MEELNDSFKSHNFSNILSETFSEGVSGTEPNVENEEIIIQNLISQLTATVPEQATNGTDETLRGESFKLHDPPDVIEILNTEESLIRPTSHNVSIINAACQQILKQMEHQLLAMLKKNRREQDIIQEFLSTNSKSSHLEISKKCYAKCAGIPYFKDPYGFQPPPNEDVLRKKRNNKLLPTDFIKSFSIWNRTDAKKLVKAIIKYDVSKPSEIDWMKISVIDMEGKYSPSECKSKWIMHLNPSINKSKWNSKEIELLKDLSAKYNYQDWDNIAVELGTNRTGLQCCIQYQTHTFPTEGKWTKEEDETLQNLVDKYKLKDYIPWSKIVWHFENRSLKQCQERYAYHLGNIKKGFFTMEEDFIIAYLASKLKNFGEVAKFLPQRVATQVRSRYEYLVQLSMPEFSQEEDELLVKLMAQYPRNWGKISENFRNRSKVQCRRRWAHLQKKIQLKEDPCSDSENDEILNAAPKSNKEQPTKNNVDAENVKRNIIHLITKPATCAKKYPEVYQRLLDYHKYCHRFLFGPKPRILINSDDLKQLTAKMHITMRNLSVATTPSKNFDINSLSSNCAFDNEDLVVLNELNNGEQENHKFELSKKIIPPNYMSLVGLRTFTLGWNKIKNLCEFYKSAPQPPSQINSDDRILCTDAKKLFKSRLKAIFAFPLILANISPEDSQRVVSKAKIKRKPLKPLSKRKRRKHAKFMSAAYRNKIKALAEQFEDSTNPLGDADECFNFQEKKNKEKRSEFEGSENSNAGGKQISRKRAPSSGTQSEKLDNTAVKKRRTTRSSSSVLNEQ